MGSAIKTIRYVYDSRGNRRALVDQDGGRFTYTYNAVNRIKEVQNPQGDRTSYSYDPAGRRTLKQLANGTRASFSYSPAGNLTGNKGDATLFLHAASFCNGRTREVIAGRDRSSLWEETPDLDHPATILLTFR